MHRHPGLLGLLLLALIFGAMLGAWVPRAQAAGNGEGPYILELAQDSKGKLVLIRMDSRTGKAAVVDSSSTRWRRLLEPKK